MAGQRPAHAPRSLRASPSTCGLMLITASIRDVYADRPFWQVALAAHFTTDENWALLISRRAKGDHAAMAAFSAGRCS